jgi:hypothetical protein
MKGNEYWYNKRLVDRWTGSATDRALRTSQFVTSNPIDISDGSPSMKKNFFWFVVVWGTVISAIVIFIHDVVLNLPH